MGGSPPPLPPVPETPPIQKTPRAPMSTDEQARAAAKFTPEDAARRGMGPGGVILANDTQGAVKQGLSGPTNYQQLYPSAATMIGAVLKSLGGGGGGGTGGASGSNLGGGGTGA